MPSDKHSHGITFHQALILAVIEKYQPLTSSEIAQYYQKHVKIEVAYNYQYIVTRRLADRGLIRAKKTKKEPVFKWEITAQGKKLLKEMKRLSGILAKL
ncbi:hypothetical protein KS4_33780 [Poriferisphaera corsica]|uniref:Uncharacterized protein n=1 Tax=Poriferisphaera corsica TaxID=2528020 RepID=A0A517YYL7_9BACT|nr:hypothetical protein [Poriferisphaera corsica]QDU35297.1 hypothetical protein KS4_33780 [Poriferisphaera corsica]